MSEQTTEVQATEVSNETGGQIADVVKDMFPEIAEEQGPVEQDEVEILESKSKEVPGEEETQAEAKALLEANKPEVVEDKLEAPTHWPEEMKSNFNALNRAGQEALLFQSKQLESGYNRKFQEVSEEKKKTAAFQGMIDQFMRDPDFAKHIINYKAQSAQQQDADPFGLGPKPDDPIEQIKWEAATAGAQAAARMMQAQMAPIQQATQVGQYQMAIQSVKNEAMQDPMYQQVQQGLYQYVESQPPRFRQALMDSLDKDIDAYKDTYMFVRNQLASKQVVTKPEAVKEDVLKTTPQRAEAPLLESAGADTRDAEGKSRQRKKDDAKLAAYKGDWQPYLKTIVDQLGF